VLTVQPEGKRLGSGDGKGHGHRRVDGSFNHAAYTGPMPPG